MAISEYGTFKENYELGRNAPFAAMNDGNNATRIVGTEEAIAGNSLVVDLNRTSGSAVNSVFFSAFNDAFKRGTQVTYKISFDYKVLTDAKNFSDVFIGLSWDEFDGMNNAFVKKDAVKGEVYHYETTFLSTAIPMTGNAYFMLFKLSGSSDPIEIAFDNFEVSALETVQVTPYEPSSTELEKGVTWIKDKGATISNGETVRVADLKDETIKNDLTASGVFGENTLHLINADGHLFNGLTKNNMIPGKKLTVEIEYYAVNDNGFCLIMMGDNGNPTLQTTTSTTEHKTKILKFEGRVEDGWKSLNLYGHNNPSFDVYLARITATLSDADPIPEDQTPKGHKVGDKWVKEKRQWGNENKAGFTMSTFDGNAEVLKHPEMGEAPTKIQFDGGNATLEWFQSNGTIENKQKYEITLTYYVESWTPSGEDGRLMYNIDNQDFVEVATGGYQAYMTPGFHQEKITYVSKKDADFFSFYIPGNVKASFYVANITYELVEIAK